MATAVVERVIVEKLQIIVTCPMTVSPNLDFVNVEKYKVNVLMVIVVAKKVIVELQMLSVPYRKDVKKNMVYVVNKYKYIKIIIFIYLYLFRLKI